MVYVSHRVAAKCKCWLEVKKLCACLDSVKQCDGGTVIAQIFPHQLEWELKSQQTTRVSEYHGSGHVGVYPCVLTLLEFTTNLREVLWWCTQWAIQQQPVPPCPISSVTQKPQTIPSHCMPVVFKSLEQMPPQWFLYQQEVYVGV